jgi:hypothetical protein
MMLLPVAGDKVGDPLLSERVQGWRQTLTSHRNRKCQRAAVERPSFDAARGRLNTSASGLIIQRLRLPKLAWIAGS